MDEVVRSKVVLIQRTGGGPEYNESFVGTVIVAEAQFCYIVTPKVMVRQEFSYDVFLPDRTVEKMTYDQFRIYDNGALAGFYVDKGVNNGITEFVIGDEATDFCEIGMCDFDKFGKLVLSYGRVICDRGHILEHDCASSSRTRSDGASVFDINNDCVLLGISYRVKGSPCFAFSVSAITQHLLTLMD